MILKTQTMQNLMQSPLRKFHMNGRADDTPLKKICENNFS